MRHRRNVKRLGRSKSHREQLVATLVSALIVRGRIRTTLAKAKVARPDAEKMVTLARKGTLASRRLAAARLRCPEAVVGLFDRVVPGGMIILDDYEWARGDRVIPLPTGQGMLVKR